MLDFDEKFELHRSKHCQSSTFALWCRKKPIKHYLNACLWNVHRWIRLCKQVWIVQEQTQRQLGNFCSCVLEYYDVSSVIATKWCWGVKVESARKAVTAAVRLGRPATNRKAIEAESSDRAYFDKAATCLQLLQDIIGMREIACTYVAHWLYSGSQTRYSTTRLDTISRNLSLVKFFWSCLSGRKTLGETERIARICSITFNGVADCGTYFWREHRSNS